MKVAYLCSRYPAISHTFILREVLVLREAGIDVHTFTIRRVPDAELLTEVDRHEARHTQSILPAGFLSILTAHLAAFFRSPVGYFGALGIAVTRRPPGLRPFFWSLFYFLEAGVLAARLRRAGITHVHAHFANVAANVARLAARLTGGTWSLTIHGHADFGDPTTSRLADKIASAAFTVCVSDFGRAQAMLQTDPVHWPRLHRVYCGIDTIRFQPPPQGDTQESPPLRLLTVARLSPEKGLTVLLDALAAARAAGTDVILTLVGDGPLRGSLGEQARRLGLTEPVTFAGPVGQDRISDFYHRADVFVLPSFSEGLPVVLMEAMASGLPVIASRITGIPELVRDGLDGLLVPPGNTDELAAAIRNLAADPKRRRAFAASARDRVCTAFDARVTQVPLIQLFKETLAPAAVPLRQSAVVSANRGST